MNKTTKIIIGIVVVLIIIAGIWYSLVEKPEESAIKVGFIGHLSGDHTDYSVPMKNAVQLAVEQINENGGIDGRKVEVIYEDDNSGSEAASAMNKLTNIDGVDYVISAQGSGATSIITPIAQNNEKFLMITLGSAPDLTKEKDFVFRSIASDIYQGLKMNEFIKEMNFEKVAGLYLNDAYGVGVKNIINTNNYIVAEEMFESGATDLRTQLIKIKESNPDVLVIVAHKEYPIILKQIKELDLKVQIFASETFKNEDILSKSDSTAEDVYTLFMADPVDYVNFEKEYKERFKQEPSAYAKYAYDGALALLKAIEEDENNIKDELLKINFKGASGDVMFNEEGDRSGIEYVIFAVKDGRFEEIK